MAVLSSEQIPIGWQAADFQLSDPSGKPFSLRDFTYKKGCLLVFTCNHCPYAKAAWPILVDLYQRWNSYISFIAINPNDDKEYPEDSIDGMTEKINELKVPFPYLRDQSQEVARIYKAQCTPDPYLFKKEENGELKLYYHGRINDNWKDSSKVKEKNLEDAINSLVTDQVPPVNQPPSMGCSIKWKS